MKAATVAEMQKYLGQFPGETKLCFMGCSQHWSFLGGSIWVTHEPDQLKQQPK